MPRGRPPIVQQSALLEAVVEKKQEILDENNSVVPPTNPVWEIIAEKLLHKVQPSSIYSYVVNNRFGLKTALVGQSNPPNIMNDLDISSVYESDESLRQKQPGFAFILKLSKSEFEELISESQRQFRDRKGNQRFRVVNILKPQKWTEFISQKIYDDFHLLHGYHFKGSYVSRDKTSAAFTGK